MMKKTIQEVQSVLSRAECLYDQAAIDAALDRMAVMITQQLQNTFPLILCVMTGALVTVGHLMMRLSFPLEIDYIHVTRYRGSNRASDLHWLHEPKQSLKDRTVLVIDDIMDGGLTLASILDYCQQQGARATYSAVMISKNRPREKGVTFEPHFVGLTTADRFLFGFGLDYEEALRNAPGIYAVIDPA